MNVRIAELERVNRLDPLEVFTVFDGQVVERGDLVASVKVAPHVVDAGIVDDAGRVTGFGSTPLVWVAPFQRRRVGVVVKESVRATAKERFEASVRAKVEGLGSTIIDIVYIADDPDAVETALSRFVRGADQADLILTAGTASTDPRDAGFIAIDALGGRVVRRGVPAHPGSMLWLARIGGTTILGLPTCGAYSKATAADLLLPRLLSGEPASEKTVAKLGYGGILTRTSDSGSRRTPASSTPRTGKRSAGRPRDPSRPDPRAVDPMTVPSAHDRPRRSTRRHAHHRGHHRGLPRPRLHHGPLARDGRLPRPGARATAPPRRRGRRRQDRARQGAGQEPRDAR